MAGWSWCTGARAPARRWPHPQSSRRRPLPGPSTRHGANAAAPERPRALSNLGNMGDTDMKIVLVTDAWQPQVNGVVTTLVELVRELQARGHEVVVIQPGQFRTRRRPGGAAVLGLRAVSPLSPPQQRCDGAHRGRAADAAPARVRPAARVDARGGHAPLCPGRRSAGVSAAGPAGPAGEPVRGAPVL